jgi:hypothetical protein
MRQPAMNPRLLWCRMMQMGMPRVPGAAKGIELAPAGAPPPAPPRANYARRGENSIAFPRDFDGGRRPSAGEGRSVRPRESRR